MITAFGLVIIIVIFHKERRILGEHLRYAAGFGISAVLIVSGPLGVQFLTGFVAAVGVHAVKITVGHNPGHIVHGAGHRSLMRGVAGRCVQGHAAPAADTDDADAACIHVVPGGKKIYRRGKIFGVNIR